MLKNYTFTYMSCPLASSQNLSLVRISHVPVARDNLLWNPPTLNLTNYFNICANAMKLLHFFRNLTSLPPVADVKENIFGCTIYPPSLILIAFIVAKLCSRGGGGAKKKARPR